MNKDSFRFRMNMFEAAKDSIFPKLVNAEMNAENLTNMPHKMMDDLAVTYAVMIPRHMSLSVQKRWRNARWNVRQKRIWNFQRRNRRKKQ